MFRLARVGFVSLVLLALVTGCMSPTGNTVEEKRQAYAVIFHILSITEMQRGRV